MLCCCSSYLEIKTRNTSTLNGGEDGGVWILLFSEVTLFESNNFVADRSLVFNLVKCHRHIEIISPLSEAFTTDQLYFNKYCFRIVAIMATVYLFKWAAWNFHSSCKWADFVAVQMGHKIKEKELKPRFHMLGNSYTIGDFTFCRLSQTLPIYWILSTRLSQILLILNLAGNGKCIKNWNLRDRGTRAQIFRGLVKSEIHCRRPRRYKFEFSFIGNDRQPSQKSWMHLENRDAPDSPDLSLTIPNDRGYLWVEFI